MEQHKCTLKKKDTILDRLTWHQKLKLISPDNPLRFSYFRSDVSIREEQLRHLRINRCIIHPLSNFRAWYQIYLIYLYASVLITKPVDAGFMQIADTDYMHTYRFYVMCTDALCWIDIIMNFFTGLELKGNKVVELRLGRIARYYIFGPYFLFDVLSSVPKCLLYYVPDVWTQYRYLVGILTITSLFKFVRIFTFVRCIKRSADYFHIKSKGMLFLICSLIVSFMIIHWMACLQFAIPKLFRRSLAPTITDDSWFHEDQRHLNLYEKGVLLQYTHCLFKSSAYILGIRIDLYKMAQPEEFLLAVFTYFIGKILIAFIWIILVVAILNSRLLDIKFLEVINQLEEYMRQKQLPLNLRGRILQYFNFKYRNKYFKEQLITSLLSENLRNEASLHVCRSLVTNVSLFCELTPLETTTVMSYLIPEIFLPNDTIMNAGSIGDAMYFLSSGTVAVYTRSGREVCHLQDGAYFGEVELVLTGQLRVATIVALETSHVYRLNKRDFERCMLTNKRVKRNVLKQAEERLKETMKMEEEYQKQLFEETFRGMTPKIKK